MYARGILFGKMKYELGDHSYVRCPENNLVADIEFKTKGYFSGTYNAIGGTIKNEKTGEVLYELSGLWNDEMHLKNSHVGLRFVCSPVISDADNLQTHQKEVLFDASNAKHSKPSARPIEEQGERESQRLWQKTAEAIITSNHTAATDEKTKIEDRQRDEAAKRADEGVEWKPRLFRPVQGGPGGPDEGEEDLDWIINAQVYVPQKRISIRLSLTFAFPATRITPRLPRNRSCPSHPSFKVRKNQLNSRSHRTSVPTPRTRRTPGFRAPRLMHRVQTNQQDT